MPILFLTIAFVMLILVGMCLGLTVGFLSGRPRQRRCACAEAKRVARLLEERKRQEREARKYSPEKVNPNSLPIIDAETFSRRS